MTNSIWLPCEEAAQAQATSTAFSALFTRTSILIATSSPTGISTKSSVYSITSEAGTLNAYITPKKWCWSTQLPGARIYLTTIHHAFLILMCWLAKSRRYKVTRTVNSVQALVSTLSCSKVTRTHRIAYEHMVTDNDKTRKILAGIKSDWSYHAAIYSVQATNLNYTQKWSPLPMWMGRLRASMSCSIE